MPDLDSIDPAFGNWLAGFADADGHFGIIKPAGKKVSRGRTYKAHHFICRFAISLRADDTPILEECQRRTGVGRIYRKPRSEDGTHPQITWWVARKADCATIVRLFDRYPLRAKKARDYAIWREAVLEWNHSDGTWKMQGTDLERMARLREALLSVRAFDSVAGEIEAADESLQQAFPVES